MLSTTSPRDNISANAAAFAAALKVEQETLNAFVSLLKTEQEALVQGDVEGLMALAPAKSNHIDLLTLLGTQRKHHLVSQNFSDNTAGMQAWLKHNHDSTAAVKNIWQNLLTLAETAQQLNQNNGLLINSRLQQNQLKLATLQKAAVSDGIYGADGQMGMLRSARSFSRV